MTDDRAARPPAKAENDAWFAYRATAAKMGREVDERTFRDAWRQGCHFTFSATSLLSPAITAFIDWMEYVTAWSPRPADTGKEYVDEGPAGARMTTEQMDGADAYYDAEAEKPTQARS